MTSRPLLPYALVATLVPCFADCGEVRYPVDSSAEGHTPHDAGAAGESCSAAAIPGPCDPVDLTGCAQGACYVLPSAGLACVCPAGTIDEGSPCNTTKLCKPGMLCAGTAPPGTCQRVCRASSGASVCLSGQFCRFLAQHPAFGYCDSLPDAGSTDS